jgi:hypothetical protein
LLFCFCPCVCFSAIRLLFAFVSRFSSFSLVLFYFTLGTFSVFAVVSFVSWANLGFRRC